MAAGGKAGIDLTPLWVPILPETSKLASGVERAGKESRDKFEGATRGMGDTMRKGVEEAANASAQAMNKLTAAAREAATAQRQHADAVDKQHTAQTRLEAVLTSGKSTTTQIASATERYTIASRNTTDALTRHTSAAQELARAQQALSGHMEDAGTKSEEAGSKFGGAMSFMATKAGAVAGIVSAGVTMAVDAAKEGFEEMLNVGKEVLEHMYEIGEAWEGVEHAIVLHSTASGEALEGLDAVAQRIARSGAPVRLDQIGASIGILHQRLAGIDDSSLQQLVTHIDELGQRYNEPVDVTAFTGALEGFKVPANEADAALGKMVNTARATGLHLNEIIEGVKRAGPNARQFGLDIGQVGGLMATLSRNGIDTQRGVMALSTAFAYFTKGKGKGVDSVQEGLQQTIDRIKELSGEGTDEATKKAQALSVAVFGTRGGTGAAIFEKIRDGSLDLDTLSQAAGSSTQSLDDLLKSTETVSDKIEGFRNRVSVALRPVGLSMVEEIGQGLEKVSTWVSGHGDQIIGWIKTFGDVSIGAVHDFASMGAGILKVLGYVEPATSFFLREIMRGFSAFTGLIGRVLEHVPGMQGIGAALDEAGKAGTTFVDNWDNLSTVLGNASSALDTLADATGDKMRTGFDNYMDKAAAAAKYTQAFGDAVVKVSGDKIKIQDNTPEIAEKLQKLGIQMETLPDGTVHFTAQTEKAKEAFQEYIKETTGKEYEVELKEKAESASGEAITSSNDARRSIEKLFGLDGGPFDVPMAPSMAPGSDPFAIPGAPGTGGGAPGAPGGAPGAPGGAPGGIPGLPGVTGGGGRAYLGGSMPPMAAPAGVSQSNYAMAWQAFQQAGFNPAEWQAYVNLEMKEAGFRADAANPSGAYGMGQFMPYTWGSYGAKTDDPMTQLVYQMKYIKDRYGSPAAAWAQYYQHKGGEGSYATGYLPEDGNFNPNITIDTSNARGGNGLQVEPENLAYALGVGNWNAYQNPGMPRGAWAWGQHPDKSAPLFNMTGLPGFGIGTGHLGSDGRITGPGTGTSDSILGMMDDMLIRVSNTESINTARSTAVNGWLIDAMNKGFVAPRIPGFDKGYAGSGFQATDNASASDPRHGGIPGAPSGMGQDMIAWFRSVVEAYNQSTGSSLQITSDSASDGSHADDGGDHSVNRAVDIGGPPEQRLAFIKWWESDAGRSSMTRQLIASGLGPDVNTYEIIGGQIGSYNGEPMSQVYSADNPGHANHIHLALQAIPGAAATAGADGNLQLSLGPAGGPGGMPAPKGYKTQNYTQSAYPGYYQDSEGKLVPQQDVPMYGTYGGASQQEIQDAQRQQESAQQSIDDANYQVQQAKDKLAKLQGMQDDPLTGEKAATQEQLDAANHELAQATRHQADATRQKGDADLKYTQTLNKPPDMDKVKGGKGGGDKLSETFGEGIFKGLLQGVGLDGSVFSDPTQWGIWKLFTGGANFLGGLMKNAGTSPTGVFAPPGSAAANPFNVFADSAGGGGGGGLGGLANMLPGVADGLTKGAGVNVDAAAASSVSTGANVQGMPPDSPANVSADGTVIPPGGSAPPAGGGGESPSGTVVQDNSFNLTVNGHTDVPALAGQVTGAQAQQSRQPAMSNPGGVPHP